MARIVTASDGGEDPAVLLGEVKGICLVGQDAAVAYIAFEDGTRFTGEAKRAPGDPFDQEIAEALAFGRALEIAGLYYQALAENAVEQAAQKEN